jgi:hypothetical protein
VLRWATCGVAGLVLLACSPHHQAPIDTFSQRFTKLDALGQPLAPTALRWSCVQDRQSGRVWENLTRDEGPYHSDWTYSWHDQSLSQPTRATGGACNQRHLNRCTTELQIQYARTHALCGRTDWRLPTTQELQSLLHPNPEPGQPPFCDCLFAHTRQAGYWSSDVNREHGTPRVSVLNFATGQPQWHSPGNFFYVRLVSGG